MRKSFVRLTATVLTVLLCLSASGVALAEPRGVRPDMSVAALHPASATPSSPLPASPFSDHIEAATDPDEVAALDVFSFTLSDGEVLKATLTAAEGSAGLNAVGRVDVGGPQPMTTAVAEGVAGRPFDIYIPAELGPGTYLLVVENWDDAPLDYEVSWEILTGRTQARAERLSGADRYAVAEVVGKKAFPGWAGVTDVIVASGDDRAMADALAAAGLSGAWRAPILLARPVLSNGRLPAPTERALAAIREANGGKVNIHVIGGTASVPPAVYSRIVSFRGNGTHERLAGADRYALSAAMAKKARDVIVANGGTVEAVLIANGETPAVFYDALAASPISYGRGMPMMLSRARSVPAPVKAQLDSTFKGTDRYLVNNSAYLDSAVRNSVAQNASNAPYNIVQLDPYWRDDTAWDIAMWAYRNGYLERDTVAVANKLPDALTGGVAMGELGAPIVYTEAGGLEFITDYFLYWNKGSLTNVYVLGGTVSISRAAFDDVNSSIEWPWQLQ